jgi:tryptophan synthase beta chain
MNEIKYLLSKDQIPTAWYNISADLQAISLTDLAPLFPTSLIEQEVSQKRWIEIPNEVQSIYRQCRSVA